MMIPPVSEWGAGAALVSAVVVAVVAFWKWFRKK